MEAAASPSSTWRRWQSDLAIYIFHLLIKGTFPILSNLYLCCCAENDHAENETVFTNSCANYVYSYLIVNKMLLIHQIFTVFVEQLKKHFKKYKIISNTFTFNWWNLVVWMNVSALKT